MVSAEILRRPPATHLGRRLRLHMEASIDLTQVEDQARTQTEETAIGLRPEVLLRPSLTLFGLRR